MQGAQPVAHPPFTNHLTRKVGGTFNILPRAAGELAKDYLFGHPATGQHRDLGLCKGPGDHQPIFFGQLLSEPELSPAGDDRHLVNRICPGNQPRNQRMTGLVKRQYALLRILDNHRTPLHAHQYLVLGLLEVRHFDLFYPLTEGGPGETSHVLAWEIYVETFRNLSFGTGNALAYIMAIAAFALAYTIIRTLGRRL